MGFTPPLTPEENLQEDFFGNVVVDKYRWLEDADSAPTIEWVAAQRLYCDHFIRSYPSRVVFHKRLMELMQTEWMSVPVVRAGTGLAMLRKAGESRPSLWRLDKSAMPMERLLETSDISSSSESSISLADLSRDGHVFAYALRNGGADEVEIRIAKVGSPTASLLRLPIGRYSGIQLSHDGSKLWFSRYSERGPRVYVVDDVATGQEREIFGEMFGPGDMIGIELASDDRALLATVWHGSSGDHSEVYMLDSEGLNKPFIVVNDIQARFDVSFAGDYIVIATRWDAPNGRVFVADKMDAGRTNWREIVGQRDQPLQSYSTVGGMLFVVRLEGSACLMERFDLEDGSVTSIALPGRGTVSAPEGDWANTEAFFNFSSWFEPSTVYGIDTATGQIRVINPIKIPLDAALYTAQEETYQSKDATAIPITILRKSSAGQAASAPTILTGYGGFNISITPTFSAGIITWLDQGGVYAVANIRGGGEMGESWHRAGMRELKQNVFDDFAAAANWLVNTGVTTHERLALRGGSNGGLLVGALITQHPHICGAAVCAVPLLDMVRYHKFLVARFWIPEYGSSDNRDEFDWLIKYSPYHNVRRNVSYPAVLFVTGEKDTRVDPLHARKMTAALQMANRSEQARPVILHYEAEGGHSAGRPVEAEANVGADTLAFVYHELTEPRGADGTFLKTAH